MRHVLYLPLIIASFSACKKEPVTSKIIEPRPEKIITSDTVTTGQWWGLTIADTITSIYKTIQNIRVEKRVNHLAVVGNIFTNLQDLEHTIPLYTSIFLDEKNGTNTGIQIYFANNKVDAIWTNGGIELNQWPSNADKAATITKSDPVENIYSTLNNIKHIAAFANKFERISLIEKDINKAYDPPMSKSPEWYFGTTVDDKRYYVVHLHFSSGLLTSIYATLYEVP